MNRGSYVVAQGVDSAIWHYGVYLGRARGVSGGILLRVSDSAHENGVTTVCKLQHARSCSEESLDRSTSSFVRRVRHSLNLARRNDALDRRVAGSFGCGSRR